MPTKSEQAMSSVAPPAGAPRQPQTTAPRLVVSPWAATAAARAPIKGFDAPQASPTGLRPPAPVPQGARWGALSGPQISNEVGALRRKQQTAAAQKVLQAALTHAVHRQNIFLWNQWLSIVKSDPKALMEVHQKMQQAGVPLDVVTCTILMDGLGQAGRTQEVWRIFERMQSAQIKGDLSSYGALFAALCPKDDWDKATLALSTMKKDHVAGDAVIYNMLLAMCGRAEQPDRAQRLYLDMVQAGVKPTLVTFNTLIDVYGKNRRPQWAWVAYESLKRAALRPDTVTYRSLMCLCRATDDATSAQEVLTAMTEQKVAPDAAIYTVYIDTLLAAELTEKAWLAFTRMQGAHNSGNQATYAGLITAFGRSGDLVRVRQVWMHLHKNHAKPDEVVYTALLSAYYSHGQYAACIELVRGHALPNDAKVLLAEHHRKLKQFGPAVVLCDDVLNATDAHQPAHHRAWMVKHFVALHTARKNALPALLAEPPFDAQSSQWCRYLCLRVFAGLRDAQPAEQLLNLKASLTKDHNSHAQGDVTRAEALLKNWLESKAAP